MAAIDLYYAMKLPPEKAVEYLASKGLKITNSWRDMLRDAHNKAFTVAGIAKLDILQDIKDKLLSAMNEGISITDFANSLEDVLPKYRLNTIYRTNLQSAYMAGRRESMLRATNTHPYWMYVAVMDKDTRPSHALLNGKVYPADDEFWDYYFPPIDYNCRCRVRPLTPSEVERKGLDVSESSEIKVKDGTATMEVDGVKISTGDNWAGVPGDYTPDLSKYDNKFLKYYKRDKK